MLDKVLKAWECCNPFNRRCFECPYEDDCFHDNFDRVAIADMVKLLKEQQAEIERLKAEKDEIIRKIGHARIDNIAPTDAKPTEVIYRHGVVDGLAYAQDIVNGKAGEQE